MRKEKNSEFGTLDNVNSEESSENGGGKTEKLFLPFPALCDDSKLSKELSFARRADLAKEDEDDDEESQELSWREKSGGNGRRWDSKLMPSKNFESWKKRKKWERDWGVYMKERANGDAEKKSEAQPFLPYTEREETSSNFSSAAVPS